MLYETAQRRSCQTAISCATAKPCRQAERHASKGRSERRHAARRLPARVCAVTVQYAVKSQLLTMKNHTINPHNYPRKYVVSS
jgi:hypothetical protein